ncbi:MAG: YggS family pyridoxal phosphate-dependent enzyme [Tetrasphaera sp.]|jgi:pyridoxal phosphate enzyme (YggS family)|nr:YggS family pyridoxal phosphate-dependent enzyme [Tetrasphaera sp.]
MNGLDPRQRRATLAAALEATRARITAAAAACGRDPNEITLVVVTKTHPTADIRLLAGLGVQDVGENRVQEAVAKREEGAFEGLRLHLIGQLQTNKAALAGRYAAMVHSLDRPRLIAPLAKGAAAAGHTLTVLIQVSLDADPTRGGAAPDAVVGLAELVADSPLRLGGVMAVPPVEADPAAAFAELARIAQRVRQVDPAASIISAGMSGDLEQAVAAGATHLRVGTAILGSRTRVG